MNWLILYFQSQSRHLRTHCTHTELAFASSFGKSVDTSLRSLVVLCLHASKAETRLYRLLYIYSIETVTLLLVVGCHILFRVYRRRIHERTIFRWGFWHNLERVLSREVSVYNVYIIQHSFKPLMPGGGGGGGKIRFYKSLWIARRKNL